jgi:hypothetical protein
MATMARVHWESQRLTRPGAGWRAWEVALRRDSDVPVDRGGLVQRYDAVRRRWYSTRPWHIRTAAQEAVECS